jgi:hypothetical protein
MTLLSNVNIKYITFDECKYYTVNVYFCKVNLMNRYASILDVYSDSSKKVY